ncbi:hypothetical protein F5Y06DRAFT_281183 [Hypoxylon sp. FL0890]|nr:hypothetical protein F5Y06DRAFT_281183 [Hypoxylon sp. FL0890]
MLVDFSLEDTVALTRHLLLAAEDHATSHSILRGLLCVVIVLAWTAWRCWKFTVYPWLHPDEPKELPYFIPSKLSPSFTAHREMSILTGPSGYSVLGTYMADTPSSGIINQPGGYHSPWRVFLQGLKWVTRACEALLRKHWNNALCAYRLRTHLLRRYQPQRFSCSVPQHGIAFLRRVCASLDAFQWQ